MDCFGLHAPHFSSALPEARKVTSLSEATVPKSGTRNRNLDRRDQAMLYAKNKGLKVSFDLATPTTFTTGEDCTVTGLICQVDKDSIELLLDNGRKPWISKAMIVGMEVL